MIGRPIKRGNTCAPQSTLLRDILKCKHIYIMLLPALLYYAIFHYAPMFGVVIAFQKYSVVKGIMGSRFVGLANFRSFLSDYNFWRLLKNTLSLNILNLIFGFPAPIIFALLLNEIKSSGMKRTIQTVTYLPHFLSAVVVCSMVLTFVSNQGLINTVRGMLGLESINFMVMPQYFYGIYVISDIWQQLGWNSIIYIAALASIDQELYEAASIDGAGRFRQIWYVTLPSIVPTIVILLLMRIGQMLTIGYEKILLLYNPSIYETADVISTYVYRRGLIDGDYSYSTAVGMFNSVINFTLLMSANGLSKKCFGTGLY